MDFFDLPVLAIGGFMAAFLNSLVGGGGLISLPVLMLLNIPPHSVLGTNKLASSSGTITSIIYFIKKKKINIFITSVCSPFSFFGSFLGVKSILRIDGDFLYYIVPFLIISLAIYMIFAKKFGINNNFKKASWYSLFLGMILAFIMGFYDGFFGPGTGLFLIFGLTKIFKTDLIFSSGNSKILNLVSNLTAFYFFMIEGHVNYIYGLFMGLFMMIGGFFGSKIAMKGGIKFIKHIFVIIAIASSISIIYKKWF